jgi:hypothetical protein
LYLQVGGIQHPLQLLVVRLWHKQQQQQQQPATPSQVKD